ncbi:MAG: hypothetical protein ACKVZJ_08965 [Phycisphaerales bacterium]
MWMKSMLGRGAAVGALVVAAWASPWMDANAWGAEKPTAEKKAEVAKTAEAAPTTRDEVVLSKNGGTVVRGQILEENATSLTMMVEFPGMPAVKTTYLKSEIVEIKRDLPVDAAAVAKDTTTKAKDKPEDRIKEKQAPTATAEDDAARIMVVKLEGEIGFNITKTAMINMFEEVDKEFNDLDSSGNVKPERKDKNILVLHVDAQTQERRGFDGFFEAEKLATTFEKEFLKGRRIVFWVDRAVGGAGYMVMISPEVYWKNEGLLEGAGDLGKFDLGDKMVNEKQISLRLGHAEGIPIKGGYGSVGVAIVRALARQTNWLTVRMEGGKPIVLERAPTESDLAESPNWIVLKDDAEGKNKDSKLTEGNDKLRLFADWARNLGLSKGTAETVEDLAFQFGVQRNWKEIEKPKAQKALEDWTDQIEATLKRINPNPSPGRPRGTMWRDLDDVRAEPTEGFAGRQKNLARQLAILTQIQGQITRFKEVFDDDGGWVSQIDLQKLEIRETMDREKREQQRQNR